MANVNIFSFCSPRRFLKTFLPGKLWKEEAGQNSPDVSSVGHPDKGLDREARPELLGFALLAWSIVSLKPKREADTRDVEFKYAPKNVCKVVKSWSQCSGSAFPV